MNKPDKIILILIGILIGMPFGLYAGATITDNHAERYRKESIKNAVSVALETAQSPLNCDDNMIIETIKGMAENGAHVGRYNLFLRLTNEDTDSP
jgi:hypothetical protein